MHKDKVDSVAKGKECGASIAGFNDYAVGDRLQAVRVREKKRKLVVSFE